jgi:ABC-2 type transport system permease protein
LLEVKEAVPIMMLPKFMQKLAVCLPSYHFAQLATGVIGKSQGGNPLWHAAFLLGFTLVCLGLARWAYLRDDGRTFG